MPARFDRIDNRGFAEYGQFVDAYGATVRVKESSAAQGQGDPPVGRLWVFITGGGLSDNDGSSHLTLAQARQLRALLARAIRDQRAKGYR